MPWLSRFQYQQGWTEAAPLKNAGALTHWLGSSSAGAKAYSSGMTPPIWLTDGKSQLNHLCGIGKDRLWLRYPLEGDFEFHVELNDGGWRESSIFASGIRFATNGSTKYVDVTSANSGDWVRYPSATVKVNDWNKYTVR